MSNLAEGRVKTDLNPGFIAGERMASKANLQTDKPKNPVHTYFEGDMIFVDALSPDIGKIKGENNHD